MTDRCTIGVAIHTPNPTHGIPFERPLEHLREYTIILKQALQLGPVDFVGRRFRVRARVPEPPNVPVLVSALRPGSYELAGEVADGAISWITPSSFLCDVARPALLAGAARRSDGRQPILVGHAFVAVIDDEAEALHLGRERLAGYVRAQFDQEMFAAAGYPEVRQGTIDDRLVREVVLHGDEPTVEKRIQQFAAAGLDELILSLLPVGADPQDSIDRTLRLLGRLST